MNEDKPESVISNVNIHQAFTLASNAVKENPKFYARIRNNWENRHPVSQDIAFVAVHHICLVVHNSMIQTVWWEKVAECK